MRAPVRLGLYAATLIAVFGVAFATAGAVVPQGTVQSWANQGDDGGHDATAQRDGVATSPAGLTSEAGGYRLDAVDAPTATGARGELGLMVLGPDGEPVTDFELSHDKELHLIAVRADGEDFRHVHPERDADGRWSIPWEWASAGSHRLYAEFVPSATGETVTVSTLRQVAGEFTPSTPSEPVASSEVDGYDVDLAGDVVAGEASTVTATVTRDGEPVTELEPYLGAYGHLVALRENDQAYLHVHPRGAEAQAGEMSGPRVAFDVTAPTPGRYLLYLDFQVDGNVRTAEFVLDATTNRTGSSMSGHENGSNDEKNDHGTGDDDDHDH
ncbi:heavy-metal-associated domain-containing protein [Aeromicrobium sp. CTD01-1L150]|uniref:heavy-metal-associated domain-containing protein n=1 Tax=Aeromicrobium sp. CTD01-1L150 TaxID=3341830 RepID=UPI0035BF8D73